MLLTLNPIYFFSLSFNKYEFDHVPYWQKITSENVSLVVLKPQKGVTFICSFS